MAHSDVLSGPEGRREDLRHLLDNSGSATLARGGNLTSLTF